MRNPSENSSFFSKAFASPTAQTSDPLPTQNITGSGDFNSTTLKNRENAEKIFPFKDGSSEETRLPPPLDENGNEIDLQTVDLDQISPELFNQSFHSAHQLELLKRFDGDLALGTGDERIDVLEGDDGRTVLILQDITKNDLAQLSIKDQTRIVNYLTRSDVPDEVKQKLAFQWEAEVGGTVEQNRETAAALVEAAREKIEAADSKFDEPFLTQLDIIDEKITETAIFSLGTLQAEADGVLERFERVSSFEKSVSLSYQFPEESNRADTFAVNSSDFDASMKETLTQLVDQEKRFVDLKRQRLSIAKADNQFDLPTLVAAFQITYNIEKDIVSAQKTLELEQNNEVVKFYSDLQRMLQEVQKKFDPSKPEEKRNIFGSTASSANTTGVFVPRKPGHQASIVALSPENIDFDFQGVNFDLIVSDSNQNISTRDARTLAMFSRLTAGSGKSNATGHPIEEINSIERPLDNLFSGTLDQFRLDIDIDNKPDNIIDNSTNIDIDSDGKSPDGSIFLVRETKTQAEWNLYSTQVADAITLLNQRTQILTNDITTANQEGNRHFEQMNNALRRSIDMINSIARTAG
ncbi:hypothetical protein FIV00_25960 [Labrenzia sp. THAF82]|nr:hypothetical protein FIV00_25960 [Labrenzia sp. THAF82]